jgi:uncharacterized protein (DUF433 family)
MVTRDDAALDALIVQDEGFPGRHNARFAESKLEVRLVVEALRLNGGDVARAASTWSVTEDEVRAAARYDERHREVFDAYFLLRKEEEDGWNGR